MEEEEIVRPLLLLPRELSRGEREDDRRSNLKEVLVCECVPTLTGPCEANIERFCRIND